MRRLVRALFAIALCLTAPGMTRAADFLNSISTRPDEIGAQLRAAVGLGHAALQQLSGPNASQTLEQSLGLMNEMYSLVRFAKAGMEVSQETASYPDPLLTYELGKTDEAWTQIRAAIDRRSEGGLSEADFIAAAIQDLSAAMVTLNEVLLLMP